MLHQSYSFPTYSKCLRRAPLFWKCIPKIYLQLLMANDSQQFNCIYVTPPKVKPPILLPWKSVRSSAKSYPVPVHSMQHCHQSTSCMLWCGGANKRPGDVNKNVLYGPLQGHQAISGSSQTHTRFFAGLCPSSFRDRSELRKKSRSAHVAATKIILLHYWTASVPPLNYLFLLPHYLLLCGLGELGRHIVLLEHPTSGSGPGRSNINALFTLP